jgi:hypothetical protein
LTLKRLKRLKRPKRPKRPKGLAGFKSVRKYFHENHHDFMERVRPNGTSQG